MEGRAGEMHREKKKGDSSRRQTTLSPSEEFARRVFLPPFLSVSGWHLGSLQKSLSK